MPGFFKRDNREDFYVIQPLNEQLNIFYLILCIGIFYIIRDSLKNI